MKKYKILIVEDEAPARLAVKDKLEGGGYYVLQAANGQEALDIAVKEHPDLILLDVVMPVMDGLTMLRNLRKDDWGKTAKVIMLTNLSDPEKEEETSKSGVFGYFVKSNWKLSDLLSAIKLILK